MDEETQHERPLDSLFGEALSARIHKAVGVAAWLRAYSVSHRMLSIMIEYPSYGDPLLLTFEGVRQISMPTRWKTTEPRIIVGSDLSAMDQVVFADSRSGTLVLANAIWGLVGEDAHKYGDFRGADHGKS